VIAMIKRDFETAKAEATVNEIFVMIE